MIGGLPSTIGGVTLALLAAILPAHAEGCAAIGSATLHTDGTLVLRLTAAGPNGKTGDSLLVYAPRDRAYAGILAHLGPIAPDETVPVCPWPDKAKPDAAANH